MTAERPFTALTAAIEFLRLADPDDTTGRHAAAYVILEHSTCPKERAIAENVLGALFMVA